MAKQKDIQELETINMTEYVKLLEHVIKTGDTLLVLGDPGIGKSQCANDVAKKLGFEVKDIRLSQFVDGGDLVMKIPNETNTAINEIVFNRLPNGKNQILFIDEFPHADESVKKAMFELIHDKRLGPYRLPEGTAVIAAGNEGHDMMSPELSSPLFDRFTFRIKLIPTQKEFAEYIGKKQNGQLIMGYLNAFKDHLYIWPEHGRVLMTPRRWEKVANYYPNMGLIKAIMPPGTYEGFQEFTKKVDMFRDINKYINGEKECPHDSGDQWAIYTASMSGLNNETGREFDDMTFNILDEKFKNLDPEIQATLILDTLRILLKKKNVSPTDLMAKLPEARKNIFRKVISRYQFTSEGIQSKI